MSPKARYCVIAAHKQIADFSSEYVKRITLFKTPLKKVGKKRECQEVSGSSPITFHNLLQLMGPKIDHADGGYQKHDLAGQGQQKFCVFRIEYKNHGGCQEKKEKDLEGHFRQDAPCL